MISSFVRRMCFTVCFCLFVVSTGYATNFSWTQAGSTFPGGRYGCASVVFNGKMWVFGGMTYASGEMNDVWWSTDGASWTRATAAAPWTGRAFFRALVFGGKMWIMGGDHGAVLNDVWWSTDGTSWTQATGSAAWSARSLFSAVTYNGCMWVMGGYNGQVYNNIIRDVWWSTNGTSWTQATATPNWPGREGAELVVLNNKMYLIGGANAGSEWIHDVWSSVDGVTWSLDPNPCPNGGAFFNAITTTDRIVAMANQSNNVSYSVDGSSWVSTTPAAWPPRDESTALFYNNKIWIFGGSGGGYGMWDVWSAVANASIKGTVCNPIGGGFNNASVTLSGGISSTTYTASDGGYQFTNVPCTGVYNITVTSGVYFFNPSTITISGMTSDTTGQDFIRINSTGSARLDWVGTGALASKATLQDNFPTGTAVCYYIKYIDPEADAPKTGYPKLHILKGGAEITGSPFVMDRQGGAYDTGAIYTSTHTLSIKGNDYSYAFEAYDIWNTSSTSQSLAGPIISNPPTITYTGANGYTSDYVEPDYGDTSTTFVYRAIYTDIDNDPPAAGYPKIHISKDGTEIGGSPFAMTAADGTDTIYSDGKAYFYSCQFSTKAAFSYCLEAYDMWLTSCVTPSYSGPSLNHPPALSWTGEAGYTNGGIIPSTGAPSTDNFCFRVCYSDLDNDEPKSGYPRLHVLKGGADIAGSPFTMSCETDAPISGSKYYYNGKFNDAGNDYTYYFEAYDVWNGSANTPSNHFTVAVPANITVSPISNNGYSISGLVHLAWSTDIGDGALYRLSFGSSTVTMSVIYEGTGCSYDVRNLNSGKSYYWQVECVNKYGLSSKTAVQSFMTVDTPTNTYNYPNPFHAGRENTNIVFNASGNGSAEFYVFSEFGKKLFHTTISAIPGTNSFAYDGRDDSGNLLFNGSYPFIVSVDGKRLKNSILVVK